MIRRPPRSTPFPTRRSSDLFLQRVHHHRADPGMNRGVDLAGRDRIDPSIPSGIDRKSTRLNSSHLVISYAVFCLKKKKETIKTVAMSKRTPVDAVATT